MRALVRRYIEEHCPPACREALREDSSLIAEGLIDSVGVLELVSWLEESFQIRVADEDLVPENLDTIDRIVAFVRSARSGVG